MPSEDSHGFFSFLLAAVFLFALVIAASAFNSQKPDYAYEQMQAMHMQDLAVKKVFYSSISNAAAVALAASQATDDVEPRNSVQFAIWHQAQATQDGLAQAGYSTLFFCGTPGGALLQAASVQMQQNRAAALPTGATPISSISCVHSFDVDLLKRKIHIFDAGFCAYSAQLGIGYCSQFPSSYEVDF